MNVSCCYKYNLLNVVVKSETPFSRKKRAIVLDTIRIMVIIDQMTDGTGVRS
jgi:hypothetical protein